MRFTRITAIIGSTPVLYLAEWDRVDELRWAFVGTWFAGEKGLPGVGPGGWCRILEGSGAGWKRRGCCGLAQETQLGTGRLRLKAGLVVSV